MLITEAGIGAVTKEPIRRVCAIESFIRDDGRGFDPTEPIGFGFLGMQERVQALGGDYSVESEIGRGTCVRIAIPIQEEPIAGHPRNDDEIAP